MTTNMRVTWLKDDTIRAEAVVTDFEDELVDPDSGYFLFYDPSGLQVGSVNHTQVGTGTYRADYIIPSGGTAGSWKISYKALVGTWPAREITYFTVAEG